GFPNENHRIVKNGKRQILIKVPKVSEVPTYISLKKQRFLCRQCHSTFVAQSEIVDKHCVISNNTKKIILNKSVQDRSVKSISESTNTSFHTVTRIINEAAKEIAQTPSKSLPEHIMIDELKTVNGQMSMVYCDGLTHQFGDIIESRKKRFVLDYFYHFSLEERKKVKTVSIDMFEAYIYMIQELFPNARIIIDRFHIVQSINREINTARIRLMNEVRYTDHRFYNKLKRHWKIFLTDTENLESFVYGPVKLFDKWMTPQGVLDYMLEGNDLLKFTHQVGHQLRRALKLNQSEKFFSCIKDETSISKGLNRVLNTFDKFSPHIMNTFNFPHLSNGPIEGFNNKIKVQKRIAYGYRNFENFKCRIIVKERLFKKTKRKPRLKKSDFHLVA
ncbi:ISL3 family transposase, partial [Staphylococcus borealis]